MKFFGIGALALTLMVSCSDSSDPSPDGGTGADIGPDSAMVDSKVGDDQTAAPDKTVGNDTALPDKGPTPDSVAADGTTAADSTAAKDRTTAADSTVAKDGTLTADSTAAKDGTLTADSTAAKDGTLTADSTAAKDGTTTGDGSTTADGSTTPGSWPMSTGGVNDDSVSALAVDATGNLFVLGTFGYNDTTAGGGSITIGSTTLTSKGGADIFLAKLDSTGKVLWATSAGGKNWDMGHALAVDSKGDAYLAASFNGNTTSTGTATFGSTVLTSTGDTEIAVAKVDGSKGTFSWAKSAGGTMMDEAYGLGLDGSGNVLIAGYYGYEESGNGGGKATFGSTTLSGKGDGDIFVAKLNGATGAFSWATSAGSKKDDWANNLTVDSRGNAIVVGAFGINWTTFGAGAKATFGSTTLTCKGESDIFVAKVDGATGVFSWAKAAPGTQDESAQAVGVDSADNPVVAGYLGMNWNTGAAASTTFGKTTLTSKGNGDGFVTKLDSATGVFKWATAVGGKDADAINAITVDSADNALVTGYFGGGGTTGTATFGSFTRTSKGKADMMLAVLSKTGKVTAAKSAGGTDDDIGYAVAWHKTMAYIGGIFNKSAKFGASTITSKGVNDAVVWATNKP